MKYLVTDAYAQMPVAFGETGFIRVCDVHPRGPHHITAPFDVANLSVDEQFDIALEILAASPPFRFVGFGPLPVDPRNDNVLDNRRAHAELLERTELGHFVCDMQLRKAYMTGLALVSLSQGGGSELPKSAFHDCNKQLDLAAMKRKSKP